MAQTRAAKRYVTATAILMTSYVVILFGVTRYFHNAHPSGPVAFAAAILPAIPIVAVFGMVGRYMVEEQDEYLRMLLVRQSLIATAFAMTIATIWGFLESFRLVPHVESYFAAILWFAGLGLGACTNRLWTRRSA